MPACRSGSGKSVRVFVDSLTAAPGSSGTLESILEVSPATGGSITLAVRGA